jgi:hypothetical protein
MLASSPSASSSSSSSSAAAALFTVVVYFFAAAKERWRGTKSMDFFSPALAPPKKKSFYKLSLGKTKKKLTKIKGCWLSSFRSFLSVERTKKKRRSFSKRREKGNFNRVTPIGRDLSLSHRVFFSVFVSENCTQQSLATFYITHSKTRSNK